MFETLKELFLPANPITPSGRHQTPQACYNKRVAKRRRRNKIARKSKAYNYCK